MDWLQPVAQPVAEQHSAVSLVCGHSAVLLHAVVRQLLQGLQCAHATNVVAGFLIPEHVFVYEASTPPRVAVAATAAAAGRGGGVANEDGTAASSARVSICCVPASRRFTERHELYDPTAKDAPVPPAASDMWMVRT